MLSNYEVFKLLTDIQQGRNNQKQPTNQQKHLATIIYEAHQYMSRYVCAKQNSEFIAKFLNEIESFGLTKTEKLQLINICPTTLVELHLIIEDSEERLTNTQSDTLLKVIANLLIQSEPSY